MIKICRIAIGDSPPPLHFERQRIREIYPNGEITRRDISKGYSTTYYEVFMCERIKFDGLAKILLRNYGIQLLYKFTRNVYAS